jgi:urate oxidase
MSSYLVENSYGKSAVRLTKVTRYADRHELKELSVSIQLQGDFAGSYTDGDNSKVIATDTIKNTVYALGAQHPVNNIESFAKNIGAHFLGRHKQVSAVSIDISQDRWERIVTDGKPHRHAFVGGGSEKRITSVECMRGELTIGSGIADLMVLKTTDSEFHGFVRDEYTTLPDVTDRIFATSIVANWLYKTEDADFDKVYARVRQLLLDVFAEHHSLAVQQTLFKMGDSILQACSEIEEIRIEMPNEHRILYDVSRFGLPNNNEIFIPTSEPFGLISATVSRATASKPVIAPAGLSSKP